MRHRVVPKQPVLGEMSVLKLAADGVLAADAMLLAPPRMLRKSPSGEPHTKRFLGAHVSCGISDESVGDKIEGVEREKCEHRRSKATTEPSE